MREEQRAAAQRLRERIGRLGVWTFRLDLMTAAAAREFVVALEALGYRALWIPESVVSKEIFSHAALLLGAGHRIIVASGIANIWARDAVAMANGARALGEAYPERFVLGLGVSHEPAVRRRGGTYVRPLRHMREYLDSMDASRSRTPDPPVPVPRLLAALGPKMLRLAAERTLGAHPYFVPVEHTPFARRELGDDPVLAVEQAAILETDPAIARRVAREHMAGYLRLENYANNLRRLGWNEADLADGGSDALVDAIVAWGDRGVIRDRIERHLAGGADHVCVQMLETPTRPLLDQLREVASLLAPVTR